jgi:hypothetical protein
VEKRYVNKFSEIAGLPEEQQFIFLEIARVEAFVTMKLSGLSALYLFGSLLAFFIPVAIVIFYFDYNLIAISLTLAAALGAQIYVNSRLQAQLIRRGLQAVLSRTEV